MKTENELILIAIGHEVEKIRKELLKDDEKFKRELIKDNIDYCIGYLEGKKELLNELKNYLDLKRSKNALYDIDSDNGFTSDDIPF